MCWMRFLTLMVEDVLSAGPIGGFDIANPGSGVGGPFEDTRRFGADDVGFTQRFALSGAQMSQLLADGQVDIGRDPVGRCPM